MRLALLEPDIPQNTGAIMRLAACLGVGLDIIEPCGFPLSDRRLRRAALDYLDHLAWHRHSSWNAYQAARAARRAGPASPPPGRIVLLTTHASHSHLDFAFSADDTLLLGRESLGAPEHVHVAADARLRVPMRAGMRSLNVALAAAIVLGEALRQTGTFPERP